MRAGGSVSIDRDGGDTVLSTRRLNRVLEHEPGDLTCIVEAGIRLSELQAALAPHRQTLALDPPGDPTVGACLAGDLSGPRRHRYGAMRDLVIGVTVVLADGTIASSGGKVVKNVAGYDLAKLFSGSRGRLGLVARVALRLHPRPRAQGTAVIDADDPREAWRSAPSLAARPERGRLPAAAPARRPLRGLRARRRRAARRLRRGQARGHVRLGSSRRAAARRRPGASRSTGRTACSPGPAPASPTSRPRASAPGRRSPSACAPPSTRKACSPDGSRRLLKDCVHCGFCLPTCPTYALWHEEMDSPRGRIWLMQGVADGTMELNRTVARALRPLPRLHGLRQLLPFRASSTTG